MVPSVAEMVRRYLDKYVSDHCKPNIQRQYRKMVGGYILPRLGTRAGCWISSASMSCPCTRLLAKMQV